MNHIIENVFNSQSIYFLYQYFYGSFGLSIANYFDTVFVKQSAGCYAGYYIFLDKKSRLVILTNIIFNALQFKDFIISK